MSAETEKWLIVAGVAVAVYYIAKASNATTTAANDTDTQVNNAGAAASGIFSGLLSLLLL